MFAAVPTRRLLVGGAALIYAAVFVAFVVYERPGLGVGHGFYVAIALLALTGGARTGAAAGALATSLYVAGVFLSPHVAPAEVLSPSTAIRFSTFVVIGTLIGGYASRNRTLLEELRILAQRDSLTGLPNTRAFEAAISRRLQARARFALLIGNIDGLKEINRAGGHPRGDDALRRLADRLAKALAPEDEIARVGGDEFAVLASCNSPDEAARLAVRLEGILRLEGNEVTFGWSSHPQEGDNALALYRAADERLYARKLVRGRRRNDLHVAVEPGASGR